MGIVGVIIVSIIAVIVVRHFHKKWLGRDGRVPSRAKTHICIWGTVAFIFVFANFMWGPLALPSKVDVSPLSQLEHVDFRDTDRIAGNLRAAKKELGDHFTEWGVPGVVADFSYYTLYIDPNNRNRGTVGDIDIYLYEDSGKAKEEFLRWGKFYSEYPGIFYIPYKRMEFAGDIEAQLYWSSADRSTELLWIPNLGRSTDTLIRIDNIVVKVGEYGSLTLLGPASSEAIAKLCEVLAR